MCSFEVAAILAHTSPHVLRSSIYANRNAFHQTGTTKKEIARVRSIFHIGKNLIYLRKFYFSNAVKSIKLEPDDSMPQAKQILSCDRYLAAAAESWQRAGASPGRAKRQCW